MKIVKADIVVVGAPWRELTILELTTDTGLTGARRGADGQQNRHSDCRH